MDIIIRPDTVREDLSRQNRAMRDIVTGIDLAESKIGAYIDEDGLEGEAFDAHKTYMEDGHLEFLGKYKMALEETLEANNKHINVINTELSSDYYNEADILREITRINGYIEMYEARISSWFRHEWDDATISRWESRIDELTAQRERQEEKLERLYSYSDLTAGIYLSAEDQFSSANELLTRIEIATRCAVTLTVSLPTIEDVREIIAIMDALFDADGNLDYLAVGNLMSRGYDNLTQRELDALTMLFGNPDICHMDLARAYQFAYSITPPENFWAFHDVLATITNRLADGFMGQVGDWLWRGAYTDQAMRESIEAQMHRIQMLAFIKGLGNHGEIRNLTDHLELDFDNNRIQFLGIEGRLSTFQGLFFGTYVYDALESSINRDFGVAVRRNPDLAGHLLFALKFIPGVKAVAGGISTARSIYKGLQDAVNWINRNETLTAAERELLLRMTTLAVSRLGGGAFSVHLSSGSYMMLGTTTMTNDAMINLTGLEAAGFPPDVAMAALTDPNHCLNERVREFLYEGEAGDFHDVLLDVYQENFDAISTQFPDLDLAYRTIPQNLPLPVLDEVTNIWGGN